MKIRFLLFVSLLLLPVYFAKADITTGLSTHITFDEETTPGKVGNAKIFDGIDDYFLINGPNVPLPASLKFGSSPFAVSFWFKGPNNAEWNSDFLIGATRISGWNIQRSSAGIVRFGVTDGVGTDLITASRNIYDDAWHHIVAYRDGTSVNMYIDGIAQSPITDHHYNTDASATLQAIRIGSGGGSSPGGFHGGMIDDVRIYNRALLSSDVQQLFDGVYDTSAPSVPPPVSEPQAPTTGVSAINGIYTVNASGGSNTFSKIQQCADVVKAGETCRVETGVYDEQVLVKNSGTDGAPVTFIAQGAVKVKTFSIDTKSYIVIKGFEITHTGMTIESEAASSRTSSVFLIGSDHVQIVNNTIHDTRGRCVLLYAGPPFSPSNYNLIQGNTISKCGAALGTGIYASQGIVTYGSHNLVENNDISHIGGDFMNMLGGDFNIFRNNKLHDNSLEDGPVGNIDHIDGLQNHCAAVIGNLNTHQLLIENNTMTNSPSSNTHFTLFQDQGSCGESGVVIRYNTVNHIGSGFIVNNQGVDGVRIYNNTIADDNAANPSNWTDVAFYDFYKINKGATNGKSINNLFYNTVYNTSGVGGNQNWVQSADPSKNIGDSTIGFFADFNLGFNSGCGIACRWNNPANGISTEPNSILNKDPLFVLYSSGNLALQSTSPAIEHGGPLTKVTSPGSGSGTVITLEVAGFFQDGYGLQSFGVQPDCIAVGSVSNVGCISSINYSTNSVTLTAPISWRSGDPVYLFKDSAGRQVLYGSVPDIGAYEYAGSVTAPSYVPGDFNKDGVVNTVDFSLMSGAWNQNNALYDLNKDGTVNTLDYARMVQNWTH